MSSPTIAALLSVVLVSAVSLVGLLTLSMNEERLRRLATIFVSFAVGALLGDTFIHLIPEMFEEAGEGAALRNSLLILAGILLFFIVEKLLHHHHGVLHRHHGEEQVERPVLAAINLFGDGIHNFIDGALIGASWLVSTELGVATTIAVLLHELPQEFGDFAVLVHSGLTVRKATLLNVASAAVAIAGTVTALAIGAIAHEQLTRVVIPLTAGGFVYIAAADLIPELQHERGIRGMIVQTLLIGAGIAVMAALTMLE